MASGFSFGFKKGRDNSSDGTTQGQKAPRRVSTANRTQETSASSKRVIPIFEETASAESSGDVQSRSVVTSLGATGFDASFITDFRQKQFVIPCKHSLPAPSRRKRVGERLVVRRDHGRVALEDTTAHTDHDDDSLKRPNHGDPDHQVSDDAARCNENAAGTTNNGTRNDEGLCEESSEDLGPPVEEILEWRRHRCRQDNTREAAASLSSDSSDQPILAAANPRLYSLRKQYHHRLDDAQLLRQEMETLPEFTHESFDLVPVESFGLAMLMGMGYDPAKHTTQSAELRKRVYQRAGLGADSEFEKLQAAAQSRDLTARAPHHRPSALR